MVVPPWPIPTGFFSNDEQNNHHSPPLLFSFAKTKQTNEQSTTTLDLDMPPSIFWVFALVIAMLCIATTLTTASIPQQMLVNGKLIDLKPGIPPLYQYLEIPDDAFSWSVDPEVKHDTQNELDIYTLHFTSLRWLTPQDSDRHTWSHTLTVSIPWKVENFGVYGLYITGCTNESESCPQKETSTYGLLANGIHAPVAVLTQIPNSRVLFTEDPEQMSRGEDAIVAYTWRHVLEHPERVDWLVYLPMAKAAHAAVRAIEEWSKTTTALPQPLSKVYLAGASKRGATTWFLGAYMGQYEPERIIGMAPMVFDVLNFTHSINNMYQSLGAFTFALSDYMHEDIVRYFNLPEDKLAPLLENIDLLTPWYRNGLSNVNKYVVSAIGDEFFLPQNDHFYWQDLPNPKQRGLYPGCEHSLATCVSWLFNGVSGNFLALVKPYQAQLKSQKALQPRQVTPYNHRHAVNTTFIPEHTHILSHPTRTITFFVNIKPTSVAIFKGLSPPTTPSRIDFRMVKLNIPGSCNSPAFPLSEDMCGNPTEYKATELEPSWDAQRKMYKYQYTHTEPIPEGQFLAAWIAASWDGKTEVPPQVYTTSALVLPMGYPHESCFGVGKHCSNDIV